MNEIAGPATHGGDTIPPPDTDRSALSEAWYRALYGSEQKTARPFATNHAARAAHSGDARVACDTAEPHGVGSASTPGVAARSVGTRSSFSVATLRRLRGERCSAIRPAVRTWRSALARRMTCRLSLPDGARIDLLLQQRGRRLHVVALARGGEPTEHRVAAALLRAQAALLAHGVRLATSVPEKGSA